MTCSSLQNEVPQLRVYIKLDLLMGGAKKKVDWPLKVMVVGDCR